MKTNFRKNTPEQLKKTCEPCFTSELKTSKQADFDIRQGSYNFTVKYPLML